MFRLESEVEPGKTATVPVGPSAPEVTVGRREGCDLRINKRTISRVHAKFVWNSGRVEVVDLGSTSGTYLRGVRVQQAELAAGDVVMVGDHEIRVHGSEVVDGAPAAPVDPRRATWWFHYQGEDGSVQSYALRAGDMAAVIGRRKDANLRTLNPSVGRRHCRLQWERGEVVAEDLNSSNGTQLNGERIRRAALSHGDVLSCGTFELRVEVEHPSGASDDYSDDWYDIRDDEDMGPPGWHLVYQDDAERLAVVTMGYERRVVAIGSDHECDIAITRSDCEADHAEINWEEGVLVLRDLKTEIGTSINGGAIGESVLRNRDVAGCGSFEIRVIRASQPSARGSGTRSAEAESWSRVLSQRDASRSIVYTEDVQGERRELTLWGDGELRLEITGQEERFGVTGLVHESLLDLLHAILVRVGFPDVPVTHTVEEEHPCWVTVFQDDEVGEVALVHSILDRSPEYAELLALLQTAVDIIQPRNPEDEADEATDDQGPA